MDIMDGCRSNECVSGQETEDRCRGQVFVNGMKVRESSHMILISSLISVLVHHLVVVLLIVPISLPLLHLSINQLDTEDLSLSRLLFFHLFCSDSRSIKLCLHIDITAFETQKNNNLQAQNIDTAFMHDFKCQFRLPNGNVQKRVATRRNDGNIE